MPAERSIIHSRLDAPEAQPMIDALIDEYSRRYADTEEFDIHEELSLFPAELFAPPYGDFLLIRRGDETVAGGAFMYLDDETAEIKRMWTSSKHRRQGLARSILGALEDEIAKRGYQRVYLTTGSLQPEAQKMYPALGYTPLFDTSLDPEEVGLLAFEKVIEPQREELLVDDHEAAARQREILAGLGEAHPAPEVRLADLV